jgi:predicted transcriptional regulator
MDKSLSGSAESTRDSLELANELFHRINRILPDDQQMFTVAPDSTAREAIGQMRQRGFSQVPVVEGSRVLGVFSYRSFAKEIIGLSVQDLKATKSTPGDLTVAECMEQFEFVGAKTEIGRAMSELRRRDGVLVGTEDRLIGILTPMDFVDYLYSVAEPFVLLSEIELALRALIQKACTTDELAEAARVVLSTAYKGPENVPTRIGEMSFRDYESIVNRDDLWHRHFQAIFGGNRGRTGSKLKRTGEIRNDLFHFRRDITIDDHEHLTDTRNWLLTLVSRIDAAQRDSGVRNA